MLLGQPLPIVAAAAAIVAAASALQATVGFGLALLAIPLLHLSGFPPEQAIAISSSAMMVQMANGVLRLRASVQARELLWPLAITMPAMLIGVLGLRAVVAVSPDLARQAAGAVVLCALVVLRVVRPAPRARVAWPWTALAMSTSGCWAVPPAWAAHRWRSGPTRTSGQRIGSAPPSGRSPCRPRARCWRCSRSRSGERGASPGAGRAARAVRPGRLQRRARAGTAAVGRPVAGRRRRGAGRAGRQRDRPPAVVDAAMARSIRLASPRAASVAQVASESPSAAASS